MTSNSTSCPSPPRSVTSWRTRHRPGHGQAHTRGGGLQPLQAGRPASRRGEGARGGESVEIAKSNILMLGPTRLW